MSRLFIIVLTGLLLGLNAFANDVLLPAFFAIALDLQIPVEAAQGLIPYFLIAAGFGQLLAGPMSDRYGRRPIMLTGLGLFVAGSLICGFADGLVSLRFGRILQGAGSAFGVVASRATLRDTHSGVLLGRTMALAMAIFAIGPITAPLVGVGFLNLGGWRTIFFGVTAVAVAILAAVMFRHSETHFDRNPHALRPQALASAFAAVIRKRQSRRYLLISCLQQSLIVMMVSNAPRLFKTQFGIEGAAFAIMFALTACGIIVGQVINHRLISALGLKASTTAASALVAGVMGSIAILSTMSLMSPGIFVAGIALFNVGFLVVLANGASLVLDPHHSIAGVAASFFGFATQVVGSSIVLTALPYVRGDMVVWSYLMTSIALIVLALAATARPTTTKSGRPVR